MFLCADSMKKANMDARQDMVLTNLGISLLLSFTWPIVIIVALFAFIVRCIARSWDYIPIINISFKGNKNEN